MPTTFEFVFAPEDETQFFAFLKPFELTMYPDRIPPDFEPLKLSPEVIPLLTEPAYYLAAERIGPVEVRSVKRGKDRGYLEVDELNSPVMHYERSLYDEDGELRSGKLWSEISLSGDMQRNPALPDAYRRIFVQVREYLVTKLHKSQPAGFLIGAKAARLSKAGTILRVQGRKGHELKPYR